MSEAADRELADRLIDAAVGAGADAADAMVVSARSTFVGVAGGELEETERAEGRDIGLRVLIGKRQACVSSADDREGALTAMVERAVSMAREAPEDPWCGLADPDQITADPDPGPLDLADGGADADPGTLERLALEAEAAALGIEGVAQIEQASATTSRDRLTLAQTNGFRGSYARTTRSVGVSALAGEGAGRERDAAYEVRRHAADLPDAAEIGARAGRRAVARLGVERPPSGRFLVLYDRRVAAGLIGHLLGAINGASVARGSSWLADAEGEAVLPKGMSLIEEPLRPRALMSRPFDAEGLRPAERRLVDDGVLTGWLLDVATARRLGRESTANARRGVAGPPSPGAANTRLDAPGTPRDALEREMGTGLVVTGLIGSSINATTGDYSRGASGYWVENGERRHAVNEITIAGNLRDMLGRIVAADDAEAHRSMIVPSLLVEGLTIGA